MNGTDIQWCPDQLQNEMVKLVPLKKQDFERLYQVASDPEIWAQHPVYDRYKREVFQTFFDSAIQAGTAFLVFDNQSGELIGSTRYYDYDSGKSRIFVGYTFLAKKYWGGQFNLALKKLMLDYAFQYVNTVHFHVGSTNIRSQKAVLKLGAILTDKEEMEYQGRKIIHQVYSLPKKSWVEKNL